MSSLCMYSLSADDEGMNLGTIFSGSSDVLRAFGAAYMRDPQTRGAVVLRDPEGSVLATFDIWMSRWEELTKIA